MKCFYHLDAESVGICRQCGKSGCRICLHDENGAMLCERCFLIRQADKQATVQMEEQRLASTLKEARRKAISRISWSTAIATAVGIFCAKLALEAARGAVSVGVPWYVLVFGGPYLFWSMYWGGGRVRPHWVGTGGSHSRHRGIIIGTPNFLAMVILFRVVIYIASMLTQIAIAVVYGIFGGGIFQFARHCRLASGITPSRNPASRCREQRSHFCSIEQ